MTWQSEDLPQDTPISALGYMRVAAKGILLALVVHGGLLLLLLLRMIECPLYGVDRPFTPYIAQRVCRIALRILGLSLHVSGTPMDRRGAVVANHGSWLDIFVLNAPQRIYFVSKDEVAHWPIIGWLARATGTVFIRRDKRESRQQKELFEERLSHGHKLLFFPEGTSSDSLRVLPFKSTLFAAFFTEELKKFLYIQPVSVRYDAPTGEDSRFYGWWGGMSFAGHLLKILSTSSGGNVYVTFHAAQPIADFEDRKSLTRHCEETIRATAFPALY